MCFKEFKANLAPPGFPHGAVSADLCAILTDGIDAERPSFRARGGNNPARGTVGRLVS
jgi:hypothetical protein